MSALKRAGTVVCEPIHRFHAEIPANALGPMLSALARLGAVTRTQEAVDGRLPTRSRSDHNPLNREEYLLRLARRA